MPLGTDVPPHPGRIGSHPKLINSSISQQLQQPGGKNGDPAGRYHPARCGNPNPSCRLLIDVGTWRKRASRVTPRHNVKVPPHPRRIGSHPRIRNTSVSLHLGQSGDENAYLPDRYRPARCGNPNHAIWLLIGSGSWSQRMARVAPRANAEVAPLTGRLRSHLQIRNPSMYLQLQ